MFQGFIRYTEKEYKELWDDALFVVDTNVLINFYKYTTKDTYKMFFDILKDLKNKQKLYIPHQVALEYFHNYEKNMFLQHEGYKKLASKLVSLKDTANTSIRSIESEYPFIKVDDFRFLVKELEEANKKVQEQLDIELKALPDVKEIQENILDLLDGIVGQPYAQRKIHEIEIDGEIRYTHEVPPGWADKNDPDKQGFRNYGAMRYQKKYGDLIMWHQMIDKAKNSSKPIIFITEEKKDDWWEKDKKAFKKPQPQLVQEFLEKTSQKFNMFRIEKFVENAKLYLNAAVSEEQIEKLTTQVENIRKSEEKEYSSKFRFNKAFDEENVDNITSLKKSLDVNKLMGFLTAEEKEQFRASVGQAFTGNLSPDKYNEAISWAIHKSINQLEDSFKELLGKLGLKNHDKVQSYLATFNSLPTNTVEKGLLLLKYIVEIEKVLWEIELTEEGFPF
ncbi:PIN-like domain-containing protein [Bacillus cereus group sp. MYBK245-2]|nr:PIN-like domain-containing protein [Bacillus pacificus]UTG90805.1 PIN domain-containing protein [Bacillus pacificus]